MTDESELIRRMLAGEERAFDAFFESHFPRLYRFALPRVNGDVEAAREVVQSTLGKAMRKLADYRGEAALFTWLCQICRNQLADARRKAARQPATKSLEEFGGEKPLAKVVQLTDFRDPLDECAADDNRGAVRRVINKLPPHYARILELRFGDELTVPEIGRVLGVSESAAESQLVRARQAFRDQWLQANEGSAGRAPAPNSGESR